MGTFSKAFGSFGSYVAASREIIDYLVNKARSFIFSTSLPPSVLAASLAAVDLVDSEEGAELRNRLASNAEYFRSRLLDAGFDIMGSETQIIPVLVGPADKTMKFAGRLLDKGIFVQGIRPPTIPAGRCRLRCTVMATHGLEDLQRTVKAIVETGKEFEIVR
jgi:glycine C-acetyltransferase